MREYLARIFNLDQEVLETNVYNKQKLQEARFGVLTIATDIDAGLEDYYKKNNICYVNHGCSNRHDKDYAYNVRTVSVDGFKYDIVVIRNNE